MPGRSIWLTLLVLAVLAAVAYAPMFPIPLIEDDFPNLWQAQVFGAPSQAAELLANVVFRQRATSYWIMYQLWKVAQLKPLVYHLTSLVLHIANVWLLYAVLLAWPRMRAAAFWAAAFFAVQEGHQEAVMWFSAINELLQFLFGVAALWCWLKRRTVAGVVLFALALLSKESAVIVVPLLALTAAQKEWRPAALRLLPYAALAGVAVAWVLASKGTSFRFTDGSFSLHAPFWLTWPRNFWRVMWIWGIPAAAAVFLVRDRELRLAGLLALAWIGLGLAPYSFLTYSTQIPSRQTYLASAGVAMLVGLAMAQWQSRRRLVAAMALLILVHNVGYLWTKKRSQFLARSAPTERLIEVARQTPGPIWVQCFPRNSFISESAVHLAAGYQRSDLVWTEAEAKQRHATAVFCYQEVSKGH